jgi:uncharacterized protein YjgD (DUF1641 family)
MSEIDETLKELNRLKENGSLEALTNLSYLLKSLKDMLNDDSIKNLGDQISTIMLITDELNKEKEKILKIIDNTSEINYVLEKVEEMRKSGALDTLVNLSYALKSIKDMLTDEAVTNLATTLSLVLEFLPKAIDFLDAFSPVIEGFSEASKNPENATLGSLISAFRDPEFQRGMGVIISVIKNIGKNNK